MERSPSSDPVVDRIEAEVLLDIAESTIAAALTGRRPTLRTLASLPSGLRRPIGVFVTLSVAGRLNGCIGAVEGTEPVGHAVARLALSAAFDDPRLPALRPAEYRDLGIEVSLLSPLAPVSAATRAELLDAVRPGRDGLVVTAGRRQGLFLPGVWEKLPDAETFLDHLWLKAGLEPRTWPAGIRFSRFTTECHRRDLRAGRAESAA